MLTLMRRALGIRTKASATTRIEVEAVRGANAIWTPRRFDQLIKEGYEQAVWVYACVSWLTRLVKPTKWIVQVNGVEEPNHPLAKLLARPNPQQSGASLLEAVYGFQLTSGNAYLERVGLDRRPPVELWVKRPDRIQVVPDPKELVRGYMYKVGQNEHFFDRKDLRHFKSWAPLDDYYGMSPLAAAARGIDTFNAGQSHNLALIQNGARPTGAWVTPGTLTDDQFLRLKRELEEAAAVQRRGRNIVMEGGATWQELGLSPRDLDYLSGQVDAARQIHAAFGVHPVVTGLAEGTYENQASAMRSAMVHVVLPWLDYFVNELTEWLVPSYGAGVTLSYDRDAFPSLSEDQESLWKRAATGWEAGFLTRNEARILLGYEPMDHIRGGCFLTDLQGKKFQAAIEEAEEEHEEAEREGRATHEGSEDNPEPEPEEASSRGRDREGPTNENRKAAAHLTAFTVKTAQDEAAYWKARDALASRWEAAMLPTIQRVLDQERKSVLDSIRASVTTEDARLAASLALDATDWRDLQPAWIAAMTDGGAHALRGESIAKADAFTEVFGMFFDVALQHALKRTPKLARLLKQTALAVVRKHIAKGIKAGDTVQELLARIDRLYLEDIIPKRALLVARQEALVATNYGARMAAKATGKRLAKTWVCMMDGRERESHNDAHGQERMMDEPYLVGTDEKGYVQMMHPGDETAPLDEVINCRCVERYREVGPLEFATLTVTQQKWCENLGLNYESGVTLTREGDEGEPIIIDTREHQLRDQMVRAAHESAGMTPERLEGLREDLMDAREAARNAEDAYFEDKTPATKKAYRDAQREYNRLRNEYHEAYETANATIHERIREQNENPVDLADEWKVTWGSQKDPDVREEMLATQQRAMDWLRAHVSMNEATAGANPRVVALREDGDTRYDEDSERLMMAVDSSEWQFIHEWAHYIEARDTRVREMTQEWLRNRTANGRGQLKTLGELDPVMYPGDTRKVWVADFADTYMGVQYQSGMTEVFSMGLQYMYENPMWLLEREPELFDLTLRVMRMGGASDEPEEEDAR